MMKSLVFEPTYPHDKRRVFLFASHVVIRRFVVAPRLATSRVVTNIHRRLAIHAHAHEGFASEISVMFPDIGEDGVGFGDSSAVKRGK
jgi:hypothetical protein